MNNIYENIFFNETATIYYAKVGATIGTTGFRGYKYMKSKEDEYQDSDSNEDEEEEEY